MDYVKRVVEDTVRKYLGLFPVIGITGPRQSGKSTLLLHLLSDYHYVNFDDPKMAQQFHEDPDGFMQRHSDKVIFDEVQRVPELFHYIKMAVDKDRQNYGKFVLTGSSQFAFLRKVSESLAGRIGLITLLPFQTVEIPTAAPIKDSVFKGGYPELVLRDYMGFEEWFAAYVETYLNKDIRALNKIGDLRDFQRLISMLAANTSQVLDMSHYAKAIGVSSPTIKSWISVLEASYIIFLLPPFYENYNKRIVKRPKIYFYDTGLVSYLTGIETFKQYDQGPMAGSIFENYIISDIYKSELHRKTNAELFFLRTNHGVEVDLIIDRKSHKEFIEIKKSGTFRPAMIKNVKQFIQKDDKGFLLYTGQERFNFEGIQVQSYQDYLC